MKVDLMNCGKAMRAYRSGSRRGAARIFRQMADQAEREQNELDDLTRREHEIKHMERTQRLQQKENDDDKG